MKFRQSTGRHRAKHTWFGLIRGITRLCNLFSTRTIICTVAVGDAAGVTKAWARGERGADGARVAGAGTPVASGSVIRWAGGTVEWLLAGGELGAAWLPIFIPEIVSGGTLILLDFRSRVSGPHAEIVEFDQRTERVHCAGGPGVVYVLPAFGRVGKRLLGSNRCSSNER